MNSPMSQSDPATAGKHTATTNRRPAAPTWFDVCMNMVIVVTGAASAAVMLTIAMDWLTSVL